MCMTRDHLLVALREGIPFQIRMADGEKYDVREQADLAVGPTTAVVIDARGLPHVLPLLTITGISYLAKPASPPPGGK